MNWYNQWVRDKGEASAKAEIRRRRGFLKPENTGFAAMSVAKRKEISSKGGKARWKNRETTDPLATEEEAR